MVVIELTKIKEILKDVDNETDLLISNFINAKIIEGQPDKYQEGLISGRVLAWMSIHRKLRKLEERESKNE